MATVKVKFRPSSVVHGEGTLFYQIIHKREVRQIRSGYRIYPSEWDARLSAVIPPAAGSARSRYLAELQSRLAEDLSRLRRIVSRLDRTGTPFTAGEVAALFRRDDEDGFVNFARNLTSQLARIGKERTAERYATAICSFERFRAGGRDIPLEEVDAALMTEYESYLRRHGIRPNSSSFYMRNLRAVYNRAVEMELTVQRYPFKHVYTGIDKTVKRAIPLETVRRIRDLDLSANPLADYARDLFLFSFYTRGMSFIDMAYLRKRDLRDGILTYRRRKTDRLIVVKWEEPMQRIVDKYDSSDSPYLLPIIRSAGGDDRRQYRNAFHLVNDRLKRIGAELGVAFPLTTYVARHAWASIAKTQNIPVSTISEALGHDSEITTRIYLASLDFSVVDRANSAILDSL